jgi:hypothetical protein
MNPEQLTFEMRRVFAALELYSDERPYCVVSLPPDQMRAATILFGGLAEAFAALIVDKDEITIVMHEPDWSIGGRGLQRMRVENGYRLITFDYELDMELVGFMAVVAQLLAGANVPMLPVAAYSRDHLLVRERDFERVWRVLAEFIEACK